MERRKFTKITTVALAGLLLPAIGCDTGRSPEEILKTPDSLTAILSEEDLRRLGSLFLEKFPEERKEETIINLLYSGQALSISAAALENTIKNQIKIDFETQQIVQIDGWILSKTEARQCALYSKN